jgi:ABC-type uncharacterized transport system ATPase subunit
MTVLENLEMGAYHRNDRAGIREDMDRVFELFPRLKERIKQESGTMSGGEQQMLAIGRALMSSPKLLLWTSPRWACTRCWSSASSTLSRTSTGRDHDPARRAERQRGARDRHPRLRP